MSAPRLSNRRAIIDRRRLAGEVERIEGSFDEARAGLLALLARALEQGRQELSRRLRDTPSAGHMLSGGHSFLIDQTIRIIDEFVVTRLNTGSTPEDQRVAILAVGGYGREEMAPHSDVDIAFLCSDAPTASTTRRLEAILYLLWDLDLTVGHSVRTPAEMVQMARDDMTVRTAMLEARFVWGDEDLWRETDRRFHVEVVSGSEREFVAEKLRERDVRHRRMGDTRYVVEPNVKEGKGGLRDLHALYWIGKYIHRTRSAADLVEAGLFTRAEYRSFRRAEGFLLAVRCHMHELAGRSEDRLTFDLQKDIAERMRFADRRGKSAVERFMQYYFLQAKRVGSLSGTFLSELEEQFARRRSRRGLLAGFTARERLLRGYVVFGGRLSAPSDDWFKKDPVRLIEIFQIAEAEQLEIDPRTIRQIDRDATLIGDEVREDPRANSLFLDVLCGRNDPEMVLRWMNEAGVFGRFVPDFGRVNAQMQFNMYHHYTVDEHTIRAIGFLSRIERGLEAEEHELATRLMPKLKSRRAAYVAVLLHDIAKGRPGDHSELGAEIAVDLCPRLGLTDSETELVAWLVLQHLLMSRTAFKRDLADPKTIADFGEEVRTLDRLRQLVVLTSVDIRAVGPGTWNSWKAQLLGDLFRATAAHLKPGEGDDGHEARVEWKRSEARRALGAEADLVDDLGDIFENTFWIAEPPEIIARNLIHYRDARSREHAISIHCEYDAERRAMLATVIARDHRGLFYRIAGAISMAGGNIIDARIYTTSTGWALDNFLIQDQQGGDFCEPDQLRRLKASISDALENSHDLTPRLERKPLALTRAEAFAVRPRVIIDNEASDRFTVVEVSVRDRPALLSALGEALFASGLTVHSAHVTAYGERAADTFYVASEEGAKLIDTEQQKAVREALLSAAQDDRRTRVTA